MWEGVGDRTELQHIDPHSYGHLLNQGPGCSASLAHVLIPASSHKLVSKLTGGPKGPFYQVVAFPTSSCLWLLWSPTHRLPVFIELYNRSIAHSLSPHNLPSEMCHFCCLWDGMFDCHRAEITVMQFRGHSLPVHQSMSVLWAFTLSHFVSQSAYAFLRITAIGMCHFLPVHHFGMECLAGSKVNIQHYVFSSARTRL